MPASLFRKAPKFWERRGPTSLLLWPLAYLFGCILRIRKLFFDLDLSRSEPAPVPIIIVGNIRVGGTALGNRVLVAGGGGGSGDAAGGGGGFAHTG